MSSAFGAVVTCVGVDAGAAAAAWAAAGSVLVAAAVLAAVFAVFSAMLKPPFFARRRISVLGPSANKKGALRLRFAHFPRPGVA